jgi:hypothetical protein
LELLDYFRNLVQAKEWSLIGWKQCNPPSFPWWDSG